MKYLAAPKPTARGRTQAFDLGPRGRFLVLARMLWVVVAVFAGLLFVAAIPAEFARLQTVCPAGECAVGQLTRESSGALAILSGPLLLHQFKSFPNEFSERGAWTGLELFYGILFFVTLFIFALSLASLIVPG